MGTILTPENAAQAILKAVATIALETLVSKLTIGKLVNRTYEQALSQFGDVVNVPVAPAAMTPNNMGFSGSITPQTPSMGNAQIVLNFHEEASFNLPSAVSSIVVPNMVVSYLDAAIKGIATSIESSILATYPLFTNAALGGNTTLGEATVDSAEGTFFTNLVPATQRKNMIVSQTAYSALRQTAGFRDFQTVGFQAGGPGVMPPVMSGRLPGADADPNGADGYLKGMYIYRSQLVPSLQVSSMTQYQNLAFADDAIGLIVKKLPIAKAGIGVIQTYVEYAGFGLRVSNSYNTSTLSETYVVDALWGTAALRPQFGVVCQSL